MKKQFFFALANFFRWLEKIWNSPLRKLTLLYPVESPQTTSKYFLWCPGALTIFYVPRTCIYIFLGSTFFSVGHFFGKYEWQLQTQSLRKTKNPPQWLLKKKSSPHKKTNTFKPPGGIALNHFQITFMMSRGTDYFFYLPRKRIHIFF